VPVWDLRNFKAPVHTFTDLPNACLQTDCILSPGEKYLVTGTSAHKGQESGLLLMYDFQTFEKVYETPVTQSSVARILWHSKLNQIMVGNADGSITVLYSPKSSVNGVKLCIVKNPRPRKAQEFTSAYSIVTPYTNEDKKPSLKRQREKTRADPILSHKPEKPVTGPGSGGRVNNSNFTHHIMKSLNKDTSRDEDPREALLKYAKVAEENPIWINHVYKKNEPKKIFREELDEEEEELEAKRPK